MGERKKKRTHNQSINTEKSQERLLERKGKEKEQTHQRICFFQKKEKETSIIEMLIERDMLLKMEKKKGVNLKE